MTSEYHDEIWRRVSSARAAPPAVVIAHAVELAGRSRDLLDLGCGDGAMIDRLCSAGARVVGADVSAVALAAAERRIADAGDHPGATGPAHRPVLRLLSDRTGSLPFADHSFDGVWCSHVLEHVVDTQTFVGEIRRVLRPGGELRLIVPDHGLSQRLGLVPARRWERHFDPFGQPLRFYARGSLLRTLRELGFDPVRVERRSGELIARATAIISAA